MDQGFQGLEKIETPSLLNRLPNGCLLLIIPSVGVLYGLADYIQTGGFEHIPGVCGATLGLLFLGLIKLLRNQSNHNRSS